MKMQKRFTPIAPDSGLRTNVTGILIDQEDFEILQPHRWRLTKDGYLLTSDPANRQSGLYLHRLVMKAPKGIQVDHINGDKLDNRKQNLRLCTERQNKCNAPPRPNKLSKYKGVSRNAGKWTAATKINGKIVCLGRFEKEIDAAKAYNAAVIKSQGEFAWLNPV